LYACNARDPPHACAPNRYAVIPGIPGYITHPERIRAILPCTALVSADDYKESSRGIMQRRLRRLVDAERSRGRHVDSASPTTSAATLAGLTRSAKNRQRVCRTPASRSRGASTRSCCRVVNAETDAADAASVSWRTGRAQEPLNQYNKEAVKQYMYGLP